MKNIGITNSYPLYLHHNSIRIAGTIRDFRTTKFAQKDGLLAAFFELFLCLKVYKWEFKLLFFCQKSGSNELFLVFYGNKNQSLIFLQFARTRFLVDQDDVMGSSGRNKSFVWTN